MPIEYLKTFLEKIDDWRDKLFFPIIKNFWPRFITPNHLTSLRIIISIIIGILLFFSFQIKIWIILLFCFCLLLDLLDGSVARALNKKTQIGAFLDPLGDKLLIIPIAIYSLLKYYKWLLLLILFSELINAILAIYFQKRELFQEANIFGKTKMVFQSVAFGIILITWPSRPFQFSLILLLFSIIFGILSFSFKWFNSQNQQKIHNSC